MRLLALTAALLAAFAAAPSVARTQTIDPVKVTPDMIQTGTDIPKNWKDPKNGFDYTVREVLIPMRDGVELHTVIIVPQGARDLPMLLERTPYSADTFMKTEKPHEIDAAWTAAREWIRDGYLLVFQDIRGKYGSKGDYVMTRPPIGPLNPTKTDDTTDAYDTVDWLVKNVKESNGRVGLIGSSYDGWTVTMALLGPHPAVKVAAPESPMIDGWMGDDWFHYGAFRQKNMDYFPGQTSKTGKGSDVARQIDDDYEAFLESGSAGEYAKVNGFDQLPWWGRLSNHPAYDAFWRLQALDAQLVARPSTVPTLWEQGLWDQEDMWGAVHSWEALTARGYGANNRLVMGPWAHSQVNGEASELGPMHWKGDTAADFRKTYLVPFFDQYLKGRPMEKPLPAALIYNPAEDHWDRFSEWPGVDETHLKPIYLQSGGGLGFQHAAAGEDSYLSDPSKPVPYLAPPVNSTDGARWRSWLLQDQRFAGTRPDVMVYETPVLTQAVRVEGAPWADLFAKITGTDADFVVKIIDVYPGFEPGRAAMNGWQLPISLDIFRGRYRESFASPSAIPAGQVQEYRFRLPTVNYTFKPGHRIMVQVQSSLFPLYDRNPQTYVKNIFFARSTDYQKETISLIRGGAQASAVLLPVVPSSTAQP